MTKVVEGHLSLEICLLGPSRVAVAGVPVSESRWARRKAKALVKLLALHPHHQLHREQLMELLYPELDLAQAASNLHRAVHVARYALEPELPAGSRSNFIRIQKGQLMLAAPGGLRVDVEEFERLAASAMSGDARACDAALASYTGDLLVEDPYEDWAAVRREQVSALYERLLLRASEAYASAGDYDCGIECLERLVARHSSDEEAQRRLMRAYAAAGDRGAALRQYRACVEYLQSTLGASPEGETQELHRQILSGAFGPPAAAREVVNVGQPRFLRLTLGGCMVRHARFSSDGRLAFCSARREGRPFEVFEVDATSREARLLERAGANVFAVSSKGELALALEYVHVRRYVWSGRLVRMRDGAAPRDVCEGVQWADWSPDAKDLAIVREVGGRSRLEFPIGNVLYETGGWISHPRLSKEGKRIAFIDHATHSDDAGDISVVSLEGERRVLSAGWASAKGLAWSEGADEILFTAAEAGHARALWAVVLDGRQRKIYEGMGTLTLHDVKHGGRVLLSRESVRLEIVCRPPGTREDRVLTWLDWSRARDLTGDGRHLLFTEGGEGGGPGYGVYVRPTDGGPAQRIGSGSALAFSPDSQWVLAARRTEGTRLVLIPTNGAGAPKLLDNASVSYQPWGAWLPSGDAVIFAANRHDRGTQLYLQRLEGEPKCLTPDEEGLELTCTHPVSPDGRMIAALGSDRRIRIYPVNGRGERRLLEGTEPGESPVRWSADGRSLYVRQRGEVPVRVYLIDCATGERTFWKELAPPNVEGVYEITRIILTPDASAWAYTCTRGSSDLYVVEGLL